MRQWAVPEAPGIIVTSRGPAGWTLRHAGDFFMIRRIIFLIIVSTLALLPLGAATTLANDKDKLIGSWKLVSAVSEELANGQKTNIYEGIPTGYISYGVDGRVITIITAGARTKPAGAV